MAAIGVTDRKEDMPGANTPGPAMEEEEGPQRHNKQHTSTYTGGRVIGMGADTIHLSAGRHVVSCVAPYAVIILPIMEAGLGLGLFY